LDKKDMDDLDVQSDLGKKIIEAAGDKVGHNYMLPYALIDQNVDFDTMLSLVAAEQLADLSYIQPVSSIFYEFNCPEKMYRELSISVRVQNSRSGQDTPSNWKYTAPEGNGANLNKLLCR
jgi:hypothetical protein